MSWFEDSNIKKSYIVQTVSDVGIFSACTQIYLTNISPCVGDTINITGNLGVSGNISGTTYFGDGSQLSGIVTTDNFVTGGVYSASSETLYFTGTTGFTPFSVDVSALLDNTNNFVTGGTYNPSTDIVTLTRNDNVNINITGVSNTFTTGATYNEGTELITFVRNDGNSYTADLSAIVSATTNSFTTGATLNGNVIEFANSVLGLDYYNVDLTSIVSGATNGYTTGATLNGNIIEFANNLLGLDYYNVDLTSLVSGKLDSTTFNTYTADTQTTLNGKLDTTSFNTYSGSVETQINNKTENTNFTSHTGDTTIHYTKGSINLSELGSSAHTHSISEVINLQTELDAKVSTTLFNTYTGDTETALGTKLDTATFNTYSGSVQTDLDGKVETTLFNTYTGDTETALGTKLPTTTFNSYTGSVVDVHVSSGNANAGTQQLSFTNTTGGTFNVTNSASLFSDNDVNVTGGTYDTNTGCVTFITNSGTTFDVCGFVTGITDTFVTGGTLTGENLVLERSSGVDVGNIDLSGLVSGKLEISLFNTYTGDTETALGNKLDITSFNTYSGSVETQLDSKVSTTLFNTYSGDTETTLGNKTDNTNFVSHTGDTTIHYTKGSINLSELGSSAHTHSISEVVNLQTELDDKVVTTLFNTYTGDTETALGTKTTNTNFTSHTGDTTIHYTKGSINLSDLGSSAHTHSISEVVNLQTNLDAKVSTTLFNTYTGDTETALGNKLATTTFNSYTGSVVDVHVSSGNANAGTQQLSFTNTTGGTFNVTNSAALFSDNDVNVTGGTYNASTGCVTFTTNSATTFDVCGFVTGLTDTFVTGGTLSGDNLVLERSSGVDVGNIDLSGLKVWTENGSDIYYNTGNVGIGTTVPQEKLHISTGNNVDSGNIEFLIGGTAGTNARTGRIVKNTSSPYEMTIRASDFTTGSNLLLNDTGGNVGIGKTSPTEALDVSGNTVMSGTLNIGTIGGTTSITNLGIDSSGNVVSGTTGGGDTYSINVTQDGDNVDLTLDAAAGSDSTVQFTAGSNITLTRNSANEVTIDAAAGGTSYWEETASTIKLDTGETTRDVVEIATGGANTLSGTYSIGNLLMGDGNTFGNGQTVRRSFIGGNGVVVGVSEAFQTSIAFGQSLTVEGSSTSVFGASHIVKGNYNFTAGQNNDLYGDNLTSIGNNNILGTSSVNINRSVVIGEDADSYADDQIVIGFGLSTNASWGAAKAIYIGIEEGRSSSGWFSDPTIGSGTNFALGGNNTMRTDVGVIKAGAGRGILYLNNYTGSSVSEPTVDISDSVGLWAKNRDTGVTGLIVKAENGGKTWIGDRIGINTVTPTEALDVSGNTVMSGTLNIGTVNAGTAVKNLAVDTNDNVVASSVPITTTYRIDSNADVDLFNDSTIQIRWDQSQDDIDMTILVDPTTSQVHVTKTKDGSDTTFDLENSDGATQIEGSMGTDDKIDIVAYAPSDNAYPHYRIKIVRSNSLNYTNSPFLVIVEKWTSYD